MYIYNTDEEASVTKANLRIYKTNVFLKICFVFTQHLMKWLSNWYIYVCIYITINLNWHTKLFTSSYLRRCISNRYFNLIPKALEAKEQFWVGWNVWKLLEEMENKLEWDRNKMSGRTTKGTLWEVILSDEQFLGSNP